MPRTTVLRRVSAALATTGAAAVLTASVPAAPGALAFPPGPWCGVAKAPVGKVVTIGGIRATLDKGSMTFIVAVQDGRIYGDSTAESVINADGKLTTGKTPVTGQFRFLGEFEVEGSARRPDFVGTWDIRGVLLVKNQEVPFKQKVKATKSHLEVDFASLDLVIGRWVSPVNQYVGWKFTAHHPKVGKGKEPC